MADLGFTASSLAPQTSYPHNCIPDGLETPSPSYTATVLEDSVGASLTGYHIKCPVGGAWFAEVVVQVWSALGQAHLGLPGAAWSRGGREGLFQGCGDHLCLCSAVSLGFVTMIHLFLENYSSQLGTAGLLFASRVLSGFSGSVLCANSAAAIFVSFLKSASEWAALCIHLLLQQTQLPCKETVLTALGTSKMKLV